MYPTCAEYESSDGDRPLTDDKTTNALISIDQTLNFIESQLQFFEEKYSKRTIMYRDNISDFSRIFL